MDRDKVEKLIEIVRSHICLYDLNHKQYKNANLKSKIWESIGRELNESDEVVRNKWKTVRDGYTKYKKQLKTSTGASKKINNYTWATQLQFLDNFNEPRTNLTIDSIKLSPRAETPGLDSDNSQYNPLRLPSTSSLSQMLPLSQVLLQESLANASPTSTSTESYRNKKRSSQNRRDDDDVRRLLNAKKRKEYDVIDNLFLSYADTFKRFPPREQAIIKLELAKLFTNTELQLLSNNSSNPNFEYSAIASPAFITSDEDHTFYSPKPQPINLSGDNDSHVTLENPEQLYEEKCNSIQQNLTQLDYDIT